jgi:lycopene beta-cyclase
VTARHQLAIVGDGPAGLALAQQAHRQGLDVVVVGADHEWTATYGAWCDGSLGEFATCIVAAAPAIAIGGREHRLGVDYGTIDNVALRAALSTGVPTVVGRVGGVQHFTWGSRLLLADGGALDARMVVDASGPTPVLAIPSACRGAVPVQTAYGLVLDERPGSMTGNEAVVMDWRQPAPGHPTFLYVVPLANGRWMVEETSLASVSPPHPEVLRARLAARLGDDLTERARHVEHVVIPMRPGVPSLAQPVVAFGAAAGYGHPATGYSVAASLAAAPRVADAIAEVINDGDARVRSRHVWHAVWPTEARRVRALHDFGAQAMLDLGDDIGQFFDAFFDQPAERWMPYMRLDATVREISATMASVFRSTSWPIRRRLALRNPVALSRLVR